MYWAYEIVAISLESTVSNDPIAVQCGILTDGIIEKAFLQFPIPNRKPSTINVDEKPIEPAPIIKKNDMAALIKKYGLAGGMMVHHLEVIQSVAEQHNVPATKANWAVFENWLDLKGSEIGEADRDKIANLGRAYYATCKAPTEKLEETFKPIKEGLIEAGYDTNSPKPPPPELVEAINLLFASDVEVKKQALIGALKTKSASNTKGRVRLDASSNNQNNARSKSPVPKRNSTTPDKKARYLGLAFWLIITSILFLIDDYYLTSEGKIEVSASRSTVYHLASLIVGHDYGLIKESGVAYIIFFSRC